jgi:hypothetical protein
MLEQDSIRLQALNDEIQNLKSFLGAANISDSAATAVQSNVQEKLQERNSLDSQISEKLAMLDQAQSELDRQSSGRSSGTGMVILVSVLSALVIGLIVALIFMLVSKPKQQVPPPWMMYPPRRPKKKDSSEVTVKNSPVVNQPAPQPVTQNEDIAVLQSEVNDMKQAVVSMSVGQPQAASKIVKDWIVEEAPPEPEPEPSVEESDDADNKKKKKKK